MFNHQPAVTPSVDREIESLVSGLIRNGNQMETLRKSVAHENIMASGLTQLIQVHRETEARLQVLIAGIERRHAL